MTKKYFFRCMDYLSKNNFIFLPLKLKSIFIYFVKIVILGCLNSFIFLFKLLKPISLPNNKSFYIFHIPEKAATSFIDLKFLPLISSLINADYFRLEASQHELTKNIKFISMPLTSFMSFNKSTNIFISKSYDLTRRYLVFNDLDYIGRMKVPLFYFLLDESSKEKVKHILHIRDLKDMCVSTYYSIYYSHSANHNILQKRKNIISLRSFYDLIYKNKIIIHYMNEIRNTRKYLSYKVVYYEDMVLDFENYVIDILSYLNVKSIDIKKHIVNSFKNEFKPEGAMKHKRSVLPGKGEVELPSDICIEINNLYNKSEIHYRYIT